MRRVGVLLMLALSPGCYRWVRIPHDALRRDGADVEMELVRLTARDGVERQELLVHRVEYPTVQGWSEQRRQELRVNALEYQRIEARRLHGGATAGLILGVVVGVPLALLGGFAIVCAANGGCFPR